MWDRTLLTLGDLSITVSFLIKGTLFLLILAFLSSRVASVAQMALKRSKLGEGQVYAIQKAVRYAVFVLGLLVGLNLAGVNLSSLTVLGGALGIGLGFGLQAITNNFVSGLILLVEQPIKVGDRVEVEGIDGHVTHVGGRSTWVRTNDNIVIVVPNSEFITNRVTNWTANDGKVRFRLPVGVSYSSDPEHVRRVLTKVAQAHPDVLPSPAPDVIFTAFGDSSLGFHLRVWTANRVQTHPSFKSELYFAIFAAFKREGIEIPFPQRDVHIRSGSVPVDGRTDGRPSAALKQRPELEDNS